MGGYKKWAFIVLLLNLSSIIVIGLINYIIDPFQHYRLSTFYKPIIENQRYINPGLAKHFDYDTIIVGSSRTENLFPSVINSKFAVKALNLSIGASTAYEQNFILDTAIKTKKVKNVILGLDVHGYMMSPFRLRYGEGSFPFYLYDDNVFNDLNYLLNIGTLKQAVYSVFYPHRFKRDINMAYYMADKYKYSKDSALKNWRANGWFYWQKKDYYKFEILKAGFDRNLLSHIKKNPEINFYIFYPPYSILTWTDAYDKSYYEDFLILKKYIFEATKDRNNVKLYDFQDENNITFNLNNYKDESHYSPLIDNLILNSIKKNDFLVTENNVDEKIDRLRKQIENFNLDQVEY